MQLLEVADLLSRIAALDNRHVDEVTIETWCQVVGDLDFRDACEAVRRHRMTSTEYLLPVHVREGVKRIRGERVDKHLKDIPPYPDPDDVRAAMEWERAWRKRLADGEVPPAAPQLPARHVPLGELVKSPPAVEAATRARRGPRTVACPWCKAPAGQPCTTAERPVAWHHEARQRAVSAPQDGDR